MTGNRSSNDSLRILFVTIGYPPVVGGIELHTHAVAHGLAQRGHRVSVLTADRTHCLPSNEDDAGVEVMRARGWPRGSDWSFAPRIRSVIAEERWDVLHLQSLHTFVAPLALTAARQAKIPYVVTFHGGGVVMRQPLRRLQVRALAPLLRRAARLVAVAPFEIELFGRLLGLDADRFALVSSGSDLPKRAKIANAQAGGPPTIASVGRLVPGKGHQRVIEALPHLITDIPDVKLLIAGAGPYEHELRGRAVALGVADRVAIRVFGSDEREAYADELAKAAAFVLMSDFETQPHALLEAAALGVPCVVSDVPGLRSMADEGLATAVSLTAEPVELARAIRDRIRAPKTLRQVRLPTWDDCIDGLEDVYYACVK
jgi:glycosyltransferase involved in cell wall biosynthesis